MEAKKANTGARGGRPAKAVKRNQHLAVKCTYLERRIIQRKAQLAHQTVSEYLRALGLSGQADMKIKALPREVILLKSTLNQLASSLVQVARRRNGGDELSAVERANLVLTVGTVKNTLETIKQYLYDRQNQNR